MIFRNTPQWFVYMDKPIGNGPVGDTLRARALKAIDETAFYPPAGQTRLRSMIENRPDWVLSRQRAWGVPIAVFRNPETGDVRVRVLHNERDAELPIDAFDLLIDEAEQRRLFSTPNMPVTTGVERSTLRYAGTGDTISWLATVPPILVLFAASSS